MRNVTKVRSRGKHFHMKLFTTISLVLSVTTLNKVLDMLVYLKFLQGSLLLAISFELRSASCVYIVVSVLLYRSKHICKYKIPMG